MTLFSEVLSRDEWLRLWDNILSNHPGFLLLCVVAYLTTARHTLLKCTQQEDFEVPTIRVIQVQIKMCLCLCGKYLNLLNFV